jgi:hypothetical protein
MILTAKFPMQSLGIALSLMHLEAKDRLQTKNNKYKPQI